MTQKALAQKLGISVRYLRKLKVLGMPTDSVTRAKAWRARNIDSGSDDDVADLNVLKGHILLKRAALLDLELKERSRILVPVADAQRILANAANVFKERLLRTAPERLKAFHPDLPREVFDTLRDIHIDALKLITADVLPSDTPDE